MPHSPSGGHHAAAPPHLRWAVITISDSRDRDDDDSGHLVIERLQHSGHKVLEHLVIPDDVDEIRGTISMFVRDPELDAIITTGGTGIGPRDVSIEAASPLLGKALPGFGELLRHLSFERVGAAAYASRAQAGTLPAPDATKLLFQLPGSPDACELAITDLILPEAGHLFAQANRGMDFDERFAEGDENHASDESDRSNPAERNAPEPHGGADAEANK